MNDSNNLTVILLVGLPGSGKSSLCKDLINYVRVNQDLLGNRNDCINAMKKALSEQKNVVIDRTNISKSQRKYFLDIAKEFKAEINCIFLDVPVDTCLERLKKREKHETLPNSLGEQKLLDVIIKFNNTLELPDYEEGFTNIISTTNTDASSFRDELQRIL